MLRNFLASIEKNPFVLRQDSKTGLCLSLFFQLTGNLRCIGNKYPVTIFLRSLYNTFMVTKSDSLLAKKIGVRIRDLRLKREITQEKLGELTGIDYKHIQRMEGSRPVNPRVDTLLAIARAFQMTLEDFFSDPMFTEKQISVPTKKSNSPFFYPSAINRQKLEEDNYSFAIYEEKYISRGHTLIYPKRKIKNYFDALPEEKHSLWDMVEKVKKFLEKEYRPDGFNIGFSLGEAAGQVGEVFFFEVIPRYKGDTRNPAGLREVLLKE